MSTGKSGSFTKTSGYFTVKVSWSETYDAATNKSVVKITSVQVKSSSYYGWTYYLNGTVKVNGSTVISMNSASGTHNVYVGATGTYYSIKTSGNSAATGTSGSITHGDDGTKSVSISVDIYGYTGGGGGGSGWHASGSETITLTAIDRAAPIVTCAVTSVSSSSMKISATSNVNCNLWEYSLDGGETWTEYSTESGTAAETTVAELESAVYSVLARARKASNYVYGTSSATSGDITPPTISLTTSSVTANSFFVSAAANVNCDVWEYSLDDGAWVQFSTDDATSGTKTISGLKPNVSYSIAVRARKSSNGLYGTSAAQSVKTLGGTVLNSVSALEIDVSAPVLSFNWTVYDASYTHTLTIRKDGTTVLTITGLTGSAGTNNKTYSLTSAQRTAILNAMANTASFTATYTVTTYSGDAQIGSASSATATMRVTAANSAPVHGGFSCADVNGETVAITGNSALYIQNKSTLRVVFNAATAKNGASIRSYRVTVGSKTYQRTDPSIDFGAIPVAGEVTLTATVVDSRGVTSSKTATLTVIEYAGVSIDTWSARRVNEVEDMAQLELKGTLSPVYVNEVRKNTLQSLQYRYKATTETSWSDYYDISGAQAEGDKFYVDNDAFASFDAEYSWDIQICAVDRLSTYIISIVLPKGKPLVAYRSQKVGINNNNPQSALDVNGEIMQNGYNVMGFVDVLDEYTTFDSVKSGGIWWYNSDAALTNAPGTEDGFLEVLVYGAVALQRFIGVSGTVMLRVYKTAWSAWR